LIIDTSSKFILIENKLKTGKENIHESKNSNENENSTHSTVQEKSNVVEGKIQRMSKAQFLIFLDLFVKLKLTENKNKDPNEDEIKTGKKNVAESTDEMLSKTSTEILSDCSVTCFEEYSNLLGLDITNYQSVYFSRLTGAIIRDSGNLKNHSEEERNNFNVFINSESGSGPGSGLKNIGNDNGNRDEKQLNDVENSEGVTVDVCGCEYRVKPFPSFLEGIKVLEFFSGIGCVIL
jgi:hypothetical protein